MPTSWTITVRFQSMLLVLALLAGLSCAGLAQGQNTIEYLGHFGGNFTGVAVQGEQAFLMEGDTYSVLDLTDPTLPTVAMLPLPVGFENPVDHFVVGDHAFLTTASMASVRRKGGAGAIALFDTESASSAVEKRTLKLAATSFIFRWVATD